MTGPEPAEQPATDPQAQAAEHRAAAAERQADPESTEPNTPRTTPPAGAERAGGQQTR